jgi:sarcosine oxidase
MLRANHEMQKAHGVDVALLGPGELAARFAWMNTDGVAGGSLGLSGEGWFDGWSLLRALRRKAASLGVVYLAGEVTGMTRDGGRLGAVQWSGGPALSCGALVVTAGPWSGRLGKAIGVEVPVWPRKRFVHVVDCREPVPGLPMLIDTTGVYVRPEGARFICGVSPPPGDDGDAWDFEVEYDLFEEVIWPALARSVPAFKAIKLVRAWAGLYDYNTFDRNAILGPHDEVANLYFATGFSGHGIQQSPAVGKVTAEWIIHGAPRSLDVAALAYERIPAGRRVREVNVI